MPVVFCRVPGWFDVERGCDTRQCPFRRGRRLLALGKPLEVGDRQLRAPEGAFGGVRSLGEPRLFEARVPDEGYGSVDDDGQDVGLPVGRVPAPLRDDAQPEVRLGARRSTAPTEAAPATTLPVA